MKKRLVVGLLSLGLAFGAVGAVSASRGVEVKEVGATDSTSSTETTEVTTARWYLVGKFNGNDYWTLGDSTAYAYVDVSSDQTGYATIEDVLLTEGDEFKLVRGTSSWDYQINAYTNNYALTSNTKVDDNTWCFSGTDNVYVKVTGYYTFSLGAECATASTSYTDFSATYNGVAYSFTYGYKLINGSTTTTLPATSTFAGTSATAISTFTPSLYSYTFSGWYDADGAAVEGTTTIGTITETVYAHFGVGSTTFVDSSIDYYKATQVTSPIISETNELYIHYWNGSGNQTPWPGIPLGSGNGGEVTLSIPSDALGMILAIDVSGTYYQTNNIYFGPGEEKTDAEGNAYTSYEVTAGAGYTHFFLDGTTEKPYSLDQLVPYGDYGYGKIHEALVNLGNACGGDTFSTVLSETWTTLATVAGTTDTASENYTAYLDVIKNTAAVVDDEGNRVGGMSGLVSLYDYVANKYASDISAAGLEANPLGRTLAEASAYHFLGGAEENASYIQIVMILGLGALAVGGFFLLRKRKGERA